MEKALNMGRTSAVGGFQLFLGRTLSTIIMAVGTIVLGMFILQSDYGLYTVALIPAATFLLFQDWGVSSALTRHCAKYRAASDETDLRKTITASLVFEVVTGTILTVISVLLSFFIASSIFHKPESGILIALASVTILSSAIAAVPGSVFVGFERMKLSSVVLLVGAVTQSILAPSLVLFGFGALGAIVGYTLGIVASAILSIALLYFFIIRKLPKTKTTKLNLHSILKPFLNFGVPFATSTILTGLAVQFIAFMMASYCDAGIIGAYKIALNFTVLLTFFTIPISTVLFPAFSKIDPQNERSLLKTVYASSAKYASLLLVPATLAVIVLGNSLIGTLYGNKWFEAPFFLSILVLTNLLVLIGNLSVSNLLLALGQTKLLLKTNSFYLIIAVVLGFTIIPHFGIDGVLFVSVISGIPSIFIIVYLTWKRYGMIVDLKSSTKILLASMLAFLATYIFEDMFASSFFVEFILGLLLFLTIFIIAVPLVGALNHTDIVNLRKMFSGLGFMSKGLALPLHIIDQLLNLRAKMLKTQSSDF